MHIEWHSVNYGTASLVAPYKEGRISQDRSCGEVGRCRHNTARLNSDGRMGIWGLTLVRLHQQASEHLISKSPRSLALARAIPEDRSNSCSGSPRLTTAYKTDVPPSQIKDEIRRGRRETPRRIWKLDPQRVSGASRLYGSSVSAVVSLIGPPLVADH